MTRRKGKKDRITGREGKKEKNNYSSTVCFSL
jgi:hypothetical protein